MFDVLGEKSSLLAERVQYSMELTCERALPTLIPMLDDSRIKRRGPSVNLLQIWFIYSNFPTSADAANLFLASTVEDRDATSPNQIIGEMMYASV